MNNKTWIIINTFGNAMSAPMTMMAAQNKANKMNALCSAFEAGYSLKFVGEVALAAKFMGMTDVGGEQFASYSGVSL